MGASPFRLTRHFDRFGGVVRPRAEHDGGPVANGVENDFQESKFFGVRERWGLAGRATDNEAVISLFLDEILGDPCRLVVVDATLGIEWRDHCREEPPPIPWPGKTTHLVQSLQDCQVWEAPAGG